LLEEAPDDLIVAVLDAPGPSWRHERYAAYKANRPPTPEDLKAQQPKVTAMVEALGIPTVEAPGHEADDLIASLALAYRARGEHVVIASADKDLLQLVGDGIRMWDPMRDRLYDPAAVKAKWGVPPARVADVLALMGDSSDNVPGVPGIGQKRAAALLAEYTSLAALLDNLAELPARKWADNLRAHPEQARLSYELVHLPPAGQSAPPVALESLARNPPDEAQLADLFRELEFFSLLEQLQQAIHQREHGTAADAGGGFWAACEAVVVTDPKILARLLQASPLAFDTETTSLDTHEAELVGASFSSDGQTGHYVPIGHRDRPQNIDWPAALDAFAAWARDPDHGKWGQNLKYDYKVLKRAGLELAGISGDAMIASYLLSPDVRGHGLDVQAERELGHRPRKYTEVVADYDSFRDVPVEAASIYAAEDALVAHQLCTRLHERLRAEDLWTLYTTLELPLVPVLAEMEWHGIRVDRDRLQALGEELDARIEAVETQVGDELGNPINLASPKQVGELLFERLQLPTKGIRKTKSGGYSTDQANLEKLAGAHPIIDWILEHRSYSKLRSTYVEALLAAIHPRSGRIHPQFHQTVAATGRLSCSDPNLQNIPVRDHWGEALRAAFIPADGFLFVGADYSQIELRILAHVTGDPGLVAAFRDGEDVHARTAADMFDVAPDAVDPELRRRAKAINFGLMYGMGARRLGQQLGVSMREAQDYIDRYFLRYPAVRDWREHVITEAKQQGWVATLFGRKRWLPRYAEGDARAEAHAERLAVNTPIQGTAADLIKRAMINIHAALRDAHPRVRLLLQIHDELLVEAPAGEAEAVQALLVDTMQGAGALTVPLLVEAGHGASWHAAH